MSILSLMVVVVGLVKRKQKNKRKTGIALSRNAGLFLCLLSDLRVFL